MEELAVHIRTECELPLILDTPTPGRGNRFFAGICEQLRRPELQIQSSSYTAASLRKEVCAFAITRQDPIVDNLAQQHDASAAITLRLNWNDFFNNMKKSGTFAEGPVLHCTAAMLKRDIAVISFGNNKRNPYLHIPALDSNSTYPPIFLGNLVNIHFQSFIPDVGVDVAPIPTKPIGNDFKPSPIVSKPAPIVSKPASTVGRRWSSTPRPSSRTKTRTDLKNMESVGDNAMKYLFKYVYKGHDCINLQLSERNTFSHDEVSMYVDVCICGFFKI